MKIDKWSKIDEKIYTWLYNYLKKTNPDVEQINFIDVYKRKLLSVIENEKKWSSKSKGGL